MAKIVSNYSPPDEAAAAPRGDFREARAIARAAQLVQQQAVGAGVAPVPSVTTPAYRIRRNMAGTVYTMWEVDGVAVNPGTVTVTIVNDSGVPVVTGAPTTPDPSALVRSYSFTPAQTANLDFFTITWTAQDGSQQTSYVEIVGGFLFSVAQAQARSPLQDSTTYPVASILAYRMLAEMAIEDACGVSFVPRYRHDVCRIVSWGLLKPSRRNIASYSLATANTGGVRNIFTMSDTGPVPMPTLNGLRVERGALVFMPALFNWWSSPVSMAYECGYEFTPPRIGRAALELARRWIVESPWDERTTGFRTRDGGQMTILTGSHTDMFDIPEVVAIVDAYSFPMVS